jgi:hypothetical protein
MDLTTAITLAVTVGLALLGYVLTHRSSLRVDQRRARLARVNEQLSEFYGPLFALSRSGEVAWRAFRSRYRPSEPFWSPDSPASDEEMAEFRTWMIKVFMPNNRLMRAVIVERADLLDEHEMPDCLVALLAHTASYEVVLSAWEDGDLSRHRAVIDFPGDDFAAYTADSFRRLKAEQLALLGRVQPRDRD